VERGGGFRCYRLAPSLLEKDRFGNWVVSKDYNAAMLAEAMCKLMGFTYGPSQEPAHYWQHGHSTEHDFIYVTTQSLTHDALKKLSEEVGPERTLLICCKAFSAREAAFKNLTLKKIPQAVLTKCEWARDDYSLSVANLPPAPAENADSLNASPPRKKAAASRMGTADLFAAGDDA
jgi:adenine-specific DNA-methyltransferase